MNVGVLMLCPDRSYAQLKVRSGGTRLTDAYPGIDRSALLHDMRELERWFARSVDESLSVHMSRSALELGTSLLGHDDSSFRWYLDGSGTTTNPDATLEQLFGRFVMQYDRTKGRTPRTDDQVFDDLKGKLKQSELLSRMTSHTVVTDYSEVTFEHAIQNGKWHCLQTVSLDSADEENMERKAQRWAGRLVGLDDASEPLKVYMVTGKPTDARLMEKYDRMLEFLRHAPTRPTVVDEEQSAQVIRKLSDLAH
jgi:hypothetical protein